MLRDNLSVGTEGLSRNSVRNYHYSLHNDLEERISQLLRGGSLKSRSVVLLPGSLKNNDTFQIREVNCRICMVLASA